MKERLDYRARKRVAQRLTARRKSNQFARLRETNWDILVVLDACRADVLQEIADWPVNTAVSPASCTPQWLRAVASQRIFEEAHVVSGNPQYEKIDADLGCATIEPFWESHWDTALQTTLPESILDRVDNVVDESAGVVAHLQQPHWPYVAKLGEQWMLAYDELSPWTVVDEEINSLQVAMQRGLINIEEARRAYESSIRSIWQVLTDYLAQWINQDYTVIVTADHGETFGRLREFGFYEHPCGCHLAPLIEVPWIKLKPTKEAQAIDSVENRLRALGYAE